jgi:N-carbamoylputrescine amidase
MVLQGGIPTGILTGNVPTGRRERVLGGSQSEACLVRIALAVTEVTCDRERNLAQMLTCIREAAGTGAHLVLFAEAAPTGLVNNDDPVHDSAIAEPIPGPTIDALSQCAKETGIYAATGTLERDGGSLYDTAVLIDRGGQVILKYRRISPRWHGSRADPAVYKHGDSIPRVETPLGSFAFLICGDLFEEDLTGRVKALNVDWLLYPFARCFNHGSYDQARWDRKEKLESARRAAMTGAVCLMVNYLADRESDGGSFGGVLAVGRDGSIVAEVPLGKPEMLVVEVG